MAVMDKSEEFYRPPSGPISGSVSRPKRAKISVVEQGFRRSVMDPKLTVRLRIEALGQLACFNPPERFLARLVRKADTPGKLRLAATQLLQKTQAAQTALSRAEMDAQEVLDGIRSRKAAAEPVKSVFGGLDQDEVQRRAS
jgi:hypothetical protein